MSELTLEEAKELLCKKSKGDFAEAAEFLISQGLCDIQAAELVLIDSIVHKIACEVKEDTEEVIEVIKDIECQCKKEQHDDDKNKNS